MASRKKGNKRAKASCQKSPAGLCMVAGTLDFEISNFKA